jgi:hypothetical protein
MMMVSYSMCFAVEARRILTWQLGKVPTSELLRGIWLENTTAVGRV